MGKRITADARAITLPVQMFISGNDFVVHQKPQNEFYGNLGSYVKEKHFLPGFFHDTFGEKYRRQVFDKMRIFIDKLYNEDLPSCDYQHADAWGPAADEYRKLKTPLPPRSLKGIYYRITKAVITTLGCLSDGINLGVKTGFNSGATLDYVYRNKASGRMFIGKLFDGAYLANAGWTGIRQRKVNLQNLINQAQENLKAQNMPVRILDVAAGHGRYILDALGTAETVDGALLRDYCPDNVAKGTALIKERGLEAKFKFEQGDAFDTAAVSAVTPKPTLAVVSGFYEIMPSNDGVRKSLAGIYAALERGGLLIYTAQPWHPQLELIARTLRGFENKNELWVMRARTQGEMDYLVREAGFIKQDEVIDNWGMFSVSMAQKP
jgi:SAM-dependent methyltransferase